MYAVGFYLKFLDLNIVLRFGVGGYEDDTSLFQRKWHWCVKSRIAWPMGMGLYR